MPNPVVSKPSAAAIARARLAQWPGRLWHWLRARREQLAFLYRWLPFGWRLAVHRRLYSLAGKPLPPLPLAPGLRRTLRPYRRSPMGQALTAGVNLIGYARGEFGVAECLRASARALESGGLPFGVFNLDVGSASSQRDTAVHAHLATDLRHPTNVFFVNADQLPAARSVLGRRAFDGRHNIGYWLWELERFPRDWRAAFDLLDEVWAPSAFVRDAIAAATTKPVWRMPMAIDVAAPTGMDRGYFGLRSNEFVTLFSFDFNGFIARKNPQAVIAAFRQAFDGGQTGVRLLIKSSNGARFPQRLAALQQAIGDDPRIELRDGFLTRPEMTGLQNACDAFISLHRAEGFGLGLAESIYLGKPVIATSYSGNLDFMDQHNSLLVDYRMAPLQRGDYPYWQGQHWAEPDVEHAAGLLRQLFDDRALGRRLGTIGAASIRRSHSRSVSAAAMNARLQQIATAARIA